MPEIESVRTRWGDYTRKHLTRLIAEHAAAVERGSSEFHLDGQPILVSFAKYLIEFLESEGLKPL